MRVLQLVAADRWTGAAATALQLAEALREAGVDCRLAFRPGRGLEERLRGLSWGFPALAKERGPGDLRRAARRVRELAAGCTVVHCHLPHDHLLARLALRSHDAGSTPRLVRSVRHPGHLKGHLYHRWLFKGVAGLGLANSSMEAGARALLRGRGQALRVFPVALEPRFVPGGARAATRARLGIPDAAVVAGTIGKIDGSRGHDIFIRAVGGVPDIWGLVIGKGPAVPALQDLARSLGVSDRLAWAGYTEDGLEHLYAAMDLFVFPAAGSDWGHRAIAEASACGVPALAADLPGVLDLVQPGVTGDLYPERDAAALCGLIRRWSGQPEQVRAAGAAAAERARHEWTPVALAGAALRLYGALGHQVGVLAPDAPGRRASPPFLNP